jgi:multimeric flavodoxin WrbA
MKIACILGSPRARSCSSALAERFCQAAAGQGADVSTFRLAHLSYSGCVACMRCKTESDKCVLDDELTAVLDSIAGSEVLVMSSPVYFGEVCAQLKACIDRTYSFLAPEFPTADKPSRLSPDRTFIMALTQGDPNEESFNDIFPRYASFYKWYGYDHSHVIRACGVEDPDADNMHPALAQAEELAAHLMGVQT